MALTPAPTFGILLKQLRKRAGMTQRDLAAALNYSDSLISSLENAQRYPELAAVIQQFIPALGLQNDPAMAARLVESAALIRGERAPGLLRTTQPTAPARDTTQMAATRGLPVWPVELIGRAESINQLRNRLLGHSGRLFSLVGPPGVGKTTLALAIARQVHLHYRDGVCFVPLATAGDPFTMAAAIVASVAPGEPGTKSPADRLFELLRHQSLLLLLDNLEQIVDAAPLVATMLSECPRLVILATSRERLHLRAEQRFKVPPLDLASAVELFVQRAQAVEGGFHLTDQNQASVTALCTRLDCLPLALELCAAQVELFSPAQLLAQLQTRPLDLLVDGAHDLPPHHRTLRGAIHRSYLLLPTAEQALLRHLSVFAGGFDLAAVEMISDSQVSVSTLHSLISKSLVRAEIVANGAQRFALLETIREFALEQLQSQGEEEALRQRHYAIYLQRCRAADHHLRGPEVALWFARLQPDYDNLRAAVKWTLASAHYAEAAWLLVASSWYCRLRGHWYEEQGWLQELIRHRALFPAELQLTHMICCYSLARSPEELATINGYAEELVALSELCANRVLGAGVWHFLAKAAPDFAQAATAWERSIALAREAAQFPALGPEFGVASDPLFVLGGALDFYATRLIEQGAFVQAAPLIEEAHAVSVARGFHSGIGAALSNLGLLALLQGHLPQARVHLTEALAITLTNIFPAVHAKTQTLLGLVTLYHNNPKEARRLLLEALELWTNIRDTPYLAAVCIYLAETALWERRSAEAEQWLTQALTYHLDPRWLGIALVNALFVAARLAVIQQQHQHAALLFGLAEATCHRLHYTLAEPVRAQNSTALTRTRSGLDAARFATTFAAGQQLSPAEAFATILSVASKQWTVSSRQ